MITVLVLTSQFPDTQLTPPPKAEQFARARAMFETRSKIGGWPCNYYVILELEACFSGDKSSAAGKDKTNPHISKVRRSILSLLLVGDSPLRSDALFSELRLPLLVLPQLLAFELSPASQYPVF